MFVSLSTPVQLFVSVCHPSLSLCSDPRKLSCCQRKERDAKAANFSSIERREEESSKRREQQRDLKLKVSIMFRPLTLQVTKKGISLLKERRKSIGFFGVASLLLLYFCFHLLVLLHYRVKTETEVEVKMREEKDTRQNMCKRQEIRGKKLKNRIIINNILIWIIIINWKCEKTSSRRFRWTWT